MKRSRFGTALALIAVLSSCGGGGGGAGGGGSPPPPVAGPAPTPPPPPPPISGCSLGARKQWVLAQMQEWYLFPETLPANLNPDSYSTVEAYLDALTANARAQGRDRFFTHLTSIKEEKDFFDTGRTSGFGVRFKYDSGQNRVFVAEIIEGRPAHRAEIDRGLELLAIGTSAGNLQSVASLMASGGPQAVVDALGPATAGTTRVLRITGNYLGTRDLTVTTEEYVFPPISNRYGAKIFDFGVHKIGYINLRAFLGTAEAPLRGYFAGFKTQGVKDVIVDVRYLGGDGLSSTAEFVGGLLGGNRSPSDVFSFATFRPEKSSNNSTSFFQPKPESVAIHRVAFIGTEVTAGTSEKLINAFIPYLHKDVGLIGTNTYGKPVGEIAVDRAECDDRLRVVAFKNENAAHQGDYYNGLASKVEASCAANDPLDEMWGSSTESSVKTAIDFIDGRPCTPISASGGSSQTRKLLVPARPTVAQRQVTGLF
jgi:carboxyl-terminal processing protease